MTSTGGDISDGEEDDRVSSLLLEAEHKVVLSIPLETSHAHRRRQFVIVSAPSGHHDGERSKEKPPLIRRSSDGSSESDLSYCILGVDTVAREDSAHSAPTIGLVLKVLWGMETSLDGDGGFGLHILDRHFMFKPTSLQFLWTVIQSLAAVTARLQPKRHSISGVPEDWVRGYEARIRSSQSAINEWHEMADILSRRPLSPDELGSLSREETDTETLKTVIRSKLREIMKTVDLDDITSKSIRTSLESEMNQNLTEFKSMIDEEMLLVFGQMDPASRIFDFLYLGSEWNANNLEELTANKVTHILNVTREIDNFFPAVFQYLNIREYDVEETDLLQYWDRTYRFIRDCVGVGGVCLVHCKMGISRSASTVISFAMKHFSWSLEQAMAHTKECRGIINPNPAFRQQLVTYEGILSASRQRGSFREKDRPKSIASRPAVVRTENRSEHADKATEIPRSPSVPSVNLDLQDAASNVQSRRPPKSRPLSWSPHSKFLLCPAPAPPHTVQYHCFSQLTQYIHDPRTRPCPAPVTATPPGPALQPPRQRVYCLPGQEVGDPEAEAGAEVAEVAAESSDHCPAQSCLSQCTCDLELELSVSEIPVDIFEETPETDKIMKNLGSLPIHIRSREQRNLSSQSPQPQPDKAQAGTIYDSEFSDDANYSVIRQEHDQHGINMECGGAGAAVSVEELSVKTLANMFDFRLSDPSMTKNLHKLIKESKIDTKYCTPQSLPTIDVENCSEC